MLDNCHEFRIQKLEQKVESKKLGAIQKYSQSLKGSIASATNFAKILNLKNDTSEQRYAIVVVNIKWNANKTGDRGIRLTNTTATVDYASSVLKSSESNSTRQNISRIARFNANEELVIDAFQNSGSDLSYELTAEILFFDSL